MNFKIISRSSWPNPLNPNTVYLEIDHWNDYSFVTMFHMYYCDPTGQKTSMGAMKIGFKGQTVEQSTHSTLPTDFPGLDTNYFSLGQDVKFYSRLAELPDQVGEHILLALRDIVLHPEIVGEIEEEGVFSISLLRDVSLSLVKGQFARQSTQVKEIMCD